jgi:transposase
LRSAGGLLFAYNGRKLNEGPRHACVRIAAFNDAAPLDRLPCAVGRRRPDLADATIAAHRRRLERQLERLLARKPTDAEGRKLRNAVYLDCHDKLFVFLKRRDAEPTNNESQRALRPSVIFRKVTNGFRSEWGAKACAALCSIVETGRHNGRSALTAIRHALAQHEAEAASARPAHAG